MPDKQKVTLYISDDLHRQFKIRSAVDGETMSSMAQRALEFYLSNSGLVQGSSEVHGRAHQVHSCPRCSASVTIKENALALVSSHGKSLLLEASELSDLDNIPRAHIQKLSHPASNETCKEKTLASHEESPDEGELITC